jgi:5-methylcytosine-specific restriction enzyme subunit McrC
MASQLRRELLVRAAMEVLGERQTPVPVGAVVEAVRQRVDLNDRELSRNPSGNERFDTFIRFASGWLAGIGWISKSPAGWLVTPAGRKAFETYPGAEFLTELSRRYRQQNKAKQGLDEGWADPRWQTVREAVAAVPEGSWTAYKDLADLSGMPARTIGTFVSANEVPGAYRVLTVEGSIAPDFRWYDPQCTDDPRELLRGEGVTFDAAGRASGGQRVTAEELREFVGTASAGSRAWLVRGSAVSGVNVVGQWLEEGFASLAASHLRRLEPGVALDELRGAVEEDYAHLTYNQRKAKTAELHDGSGPAGRSERQGLRPRFQDRPLVPDAQARGRQRHRAGTDLADGDPAAAGGAALRRPDDRRPPPVRVARPAQGDRARHARGRRADDRRADDRRADDRRADDRRADGRRTDGRRTDGRRADGRRTDGRRADGRRADGRRADGRRACRGRRPGERRLGHARRCLLTTADRVAEGAFVRVSLVENGPAAEVSIPQAVGAALAGAGFVDARPVPGTRLWSLKPGSKVGAVAVPGLEVQVAPKIPIARVVFLLEHTRSGVSWRGDHVAVSEADDLLRAVVEAFERITSRALRQGLVQGYRTVEESLPVVRGRIRETDQLRHRYGLPLPVEVRYDDFTPDTPENRLLRAAVILARRLPALPQDLRHRLLRLDARLADVTPVTARAALEPWTPSRLNARLHHALHLAEVIVRHASFEPAGGGLVVTGFVVNMAKVFEDFLCAQLGPRLTATAGRTRTQDRWHLDVDEQVTMRPDLVWYADGPAPTAVIDAKYKAEKPAGFPDADLYQMLAYCTALRLPVGHLVYAKGNEAGRTHRVAGAGITLQAHTLDLSRSPGGLLTEIDTLAESIVRASKGQGLGACVADGHRPRFYRPRF